MQKKLKILLVPNFSTRYDLKILRYLAAELSNLGCDCEVSLHPLTSNKIYYTIDSIAYKLKKTEKEVYREIRADVLLEINRFRSKYLNKKITHINWIQDLPKREFRYLERIQNNSIHYLYGSPAFFGLDKKKLNFKNQKILFAGYSPKNSNLVRSEKYDINLLGYMSTIFEVCGSKDDYFFGTHQNLSQKSILSLVCKQILRKPFILINILKGLSLNLPSKYFVSNEFKSLLQIIREKYDPLTGNLNMNMFGKKENYFIEELKNYLLLEYPRYKDRLVLFNLIKTLDPKYKKIVAGPNWKNYFPEYEFVKDPKDELEIFSKSKITIHNNTHGLGLHPRIFECIACGSFPFMHATVHNCEEGALDKVLEPDRHFGLFSKENLVESIESWVNDHDKRRRGVLEAQKIMESCHTWKKRAEQVLIDLKNQ